MTGAPLKYTITTVMFLFVPEFFKHSESYLAEILNLEFLLLSNLSLCSIKIFFMTLWLHSLCDTLLLNVSNLAQTWILIGGFCTSVLIMLTCASTFFYLIDIWLHQLANYLQIFNQSWSLVLDLLVFKIYLLDSGWVLAG